MLNANLGFASYSVDDLDRAKEFYGGVLGLEVSEREMSTLELKLPGGGGVMLYPKPNHEPATFTVLNFMVPDIDAAVDYLTGAGVPFEHYDMPEIKTDERGISRDDSGQGPTAIAWFTDPSRNIIALIQA